MEKKDVMALVAFGSNQGNSWGIVRRAVQRIGKEPGIRILSVSSLYRTKPVGGPAQKDFLNGAIKLSTTLSPMALLAALQSVEKQFGRKRGSRWGPRTLDLDLLTYGRMRMKNRRLVLPHPRYHHRRFVLEPLCEISPRSIHSSLNRSHRSLLRQLTVSGQRVTIIGQWKKSRFCRFKNGKKKKSR